MDTHRHHLIPGDEEYESFLVRLWTTTGETSSLTYGFQIEVQHIQSGHTNRFYSLAEFVDYFRLKMQQKSPYEK